MNPAVYNALPKLGKSLHSVTSPAAHSYNCIAWAAEQNNKWWWPDPHNYGYWPPGVVREETLGAFIAAYGTLGYAPCDNSLPEPDAEKIAIFTDGGMPTHAARQLADGTWTSKLGNFEDICHQTLDALEGGKYGSVAQIMSRKRQR